MLFWMPLVQLGDLALTLPAGAAIAAWLGAWRAWRMAACWSVLFVMCLGLVGASKIAYMGWGGGWDAVSFKAISGHAAGVAAVFPILFYLLLQRCGARCRAAGVAAGLALGALEATVLVFMQEHSASEALAGWALGATVSLAAIGWSGPLPRPRPLAGLVCFALVFSLSAWLMQSATIGYWMIDAAQFLSGNNTLFSLSFNSV